MNVDYRSSGVDQEKANRLVSEIKRMAATTKRPEVIGSIGGFAGFCNLPSGYSDPVLLSSTDGVGTKLLLAVAANRHDTVGIDLVAMNVNDLICHGAEPLFFLDYIAVPSLDEEQYLAILRGVAEGCRQAGCALLGGGTAQLPGLYQPGDYDLAGFAVGVAERSRIIDGSKISRGDVVLALPSSGLHSNGYSLARKALLEMAGYKLEETIPELGKTLADELLTPTRIYVREILALLKSSVEVHAISHITGGGFPDNIGRLLPRHLSVNIDVLTWQILPIFALIRECGEVPIEEMYSIFNMGVGMTLIMPPIQVEPAKAFLANLKLDTFVIGEVVEGDGSVKMVGL
jgi:phosphoribosylformylglycinamidine cyclo-ligase